MYRYIFRESCSQFDSLPLTSLTIPLDQALAHGLRSVALCAVSTGIFGYDVRKATPVAMAAVREWLEAGDHAAQMTAVIFCVFSNADAAIYKSYMPLMFPPAE